MAPCWHESHKHQQWSGYQTSIPSRLDWSRNVHGRSPLSDWRQCCCLTWDLSCSRKSQNMTNLFLRRIFRRSTNSYTLQEFEDKKPVQRYRSIIHQFVHTHWHLDASDVFADCSAIATRELAVLLLLETITLPPPETSKRSHSSRRAPHCRKLNGQVPGKKHFSGPRHVLAP